ncbi:tRNA (adenine(22)-N(1))-methyltransferase TrmK [Telmatocola sphagniphila]|uniref:tRNA (Adenine(22)-N(1))-methyltransferase TrmK n=1 Tax=Telmatocola sphagniphila TaxID=1123043 RepID=A0A8E6B8J3_9BACT|nr:TIGR03000 domain-containing protein [Telmatocola sphagniphila]QVL32493.1 tRNA (adenine(22)-N(1))-methyltransferase TrmK [Telmatocola sphagniphila]
MSRYVALLVFPLVFLCSSGISAQDKKAPPSPPDPPTKAEMKVSKIQVIVPPNADVELSIDGKKLRTTGDVREFKTPALEAGKKYEYLIEALIVPNNYTKIRRPRKVTFKAGEDLTIDMTKEDKAVDKIEVRWVPTPDDIVDEMAKIAKVTKDDVVYDLGCGDGIMLIRSVKVMGAKRGVGIELKEDIVKQAKERVEKEGLKDKIEIRQGDILDVKDMSDASVVMLYIGDDLGARLEPVLRKTLKPGARVVSHRFLLGGWKPDKTVTVQGKDGDEYTIHLWEVPAK